MLIYNSRTGIQPLIYLTIILLAYFGYVISDFSFEKQICYWIFVCIYCFTIIDIYSRFIIFYDDRIEIRYPTNPFIKQKEVMLKAIQKVVITTICMKGDTRPPITIWYNQDSKLKRIIVRRNLKNIKTLITFLHNKNINTELIGFDNEVS